MNASVAQRKAAERARHKEAGRVSVTVFIYPDDRDNLGRYIKRLNQRRERSATTGKDAAIAAQGTADGGA